MLVMYSEDCLQGQYEVNGGGDVALQHTASYWKGVREEGLAISPVCFRYCVGCPVDGSEHAPRLDRRLGILQRSIEEFVRNRAV